MAPDASMRDELVERLRTKDAIILVVIAAKPEIDPRALPTRRWRARLTIKRLLDHNLIEPRETSDGFKRYVATGLGEAVARCWLVSTEVASFEPDIVRHSRRDALKAPFPPDSNPWL